MSSIEFDWNLVPLGSIYHAGFTVVAWLRRETSQFNFLIISRNWTEDSDFIFLFLIICIFLSEFSCRKVRQYCDNLNWIKLAMKFETARIHLISQSATRQLVIKFTTYKLTSHVDLRTSEQLYYHIDRIDIKTSDFTSWSLACSVEKLPVERRTWLWHPRLYIDYKNSKVFSFLFSVVFCLFVCLFFFLEMSYNHLVFSSWMT